jgi:hemolysin D
MQSSRWILSLINRMGINRENPLAKSSEDKEGTPALELPEAAPWVKTTLLTITAGITILGLWSIFARLDVVVSATGRLEPQSASQPVQTKIGGAVTNILVQEGTRVRRGQLLMQLDKTELLTQLETLARQREPLARQVAVLSAVRQGAPISAIGKNIGAIPPELVNQAQDRQLLVAQVTGKAAGLSPEQQQRFNLFQQQIADIETLGAIQVNNIAVQRSGADATTQANAAKLQIEREMLANLEPLVREGAISRRLFLDGVSRVNDVQTQFNQSRVQGSNLRLTQQEAQVSGRSSVLELIAETQTRLGQLDSNLDAKIEATKQQLTQLDGQFRQVQLNLEAQNLKAPVNGFVFDLKTRIPGFFAGQGETLLQVTPDERLVARINVPNRDIGELTLGQSVNIRVDAFPFTEFGALEGKITKIATDSVNPETNPNSPSVFPVEVSLTRQTLERGEEDLTLTPGMTVAGNIIIRSRPPIALVFDRLIGLFDSAQSVR